MLNAYTPQPPPNPDYVLSPNRTILLTLLPFALAFVLLCTSNARWPLGGGRGLNKMARAVLKRPELSWCQPLRCVK